MNQKSSVNILLIVLVVVITGVVGYFAFTQKATKSSSSLTSRDETVNWQTYQNTKFGIQLEYPADILVIQGDDQYSKTITLLDKKFAGGNVNIATIPNYFSINLAKDNSIDSLIEGEKIFFSAPKSEITILKTEEMTIDGVRAVQVITGEKVTQEPIGFFIVTTLPRLVSIQLPSSVPVRPGSNFSTYNLVSFSGRLEDPNLANKIIESIRFLK